MDELLKTNITSTFMKTQKQKLSKPDDVFSKYCNSTVEETTIALDALEYYRNVPNITFSQCCEVYPYYLIWV